SHPHSILDSEGRIIGALVGRPSHPGWEDAKRDACDALRHIRLESEAGGCFGPDDLDHRRGRFLALPVGISYGGGQMVCFPCSYPILVSSAFYFTHDYLCIPFPPYSEAFFSFAPKAYRDVQATMRALQQHHPALRLNFPNSIYAAISLNCGPDTTCLEHLDSGNAPHSFCAVTALGEFDPDKGGHLVLFDLRMIIRFPPGSTILLLSAVLAHGNTPIALGDVRYSMTQYFSGGLARWVAYGFRPVKSLGPAKQVKMIHEKVDGQPGERWREKLGLLSTMSSLKGDYSTS
ncbi:hypothetical protein BDN72DRAFT_766924, partial [Pluteus cervinus]